MEGLFAPSPTDSLGTAFMAAYLAFPPSPCYVPLRGLAAPPGISGGCLVASRSVSAGSVLLTMGGIGVNVGASTLNMGGLGVPGGMPVSNMGGLGRRPDPDEGVLASTCSQHGSLLPSSDLGHLPFYRPPTLGASNGLGILLPLAAFGGFAGVPLSGSPPPLSVR